MSKGFVELESGLIVPVEKTEAPNVKRPGLQGHGTLDLESKGTPEIRHKSVEQIRDFPPTSSDCEKQTVLFEGEYNRTYADWHPQWGGYCGKAVVIVSPGRLDCCFDVINWHDGEFPRDETYTEYHYCAPTQLVDFGITVLEKQLDGVAVLSQGAQIDGYRELAARLIAIADKIEGMEQLC